MPNAKVSASELLSIIRTTAPGLAARRIRSQSELIADSLVRERLMSVVSATLSMVATLLAAVGLAGSVAQSVATRTKELGIRLALGALHGELVFQSAKRAMAPVAAGVAIGMPLSVAASRLLRSVLFGVEPSDGFVLSAAILLLTVIAGAAASISSLRATRVDAAAAIRQE